MNLGGTNVHTSFSVNVLLKCRKRYSTELLFCSVYISYLSDDDFITPSFICIIGNLSGKKAELVYFLIKSLGSKNISPSSIIRDGEFSDRKVSPKRIDSVSPKLLTSYLMLLSLSSNVLPQYIVSESSKIVLSS